MIRFNCLLRDEGLYPTDVKLVRHKATRRRGRPTPYQLWRAADGRLELYQSIQRRAVFEGARLLASFVATPLNETLFVGLYAVNGVGTAAPGLLDPISGKDVGGLHLYDLAMAQELAEYRGRLIVEWGDAYRAWVQLARNQDKAVIEIRRSVDEPPFPGFHDICDRLSGLATVPLSWREVLSSVGGVYLLTCPDTGKQYVGSARGAAGFWGRWEEYIADGHGGNRRMQEVPAADYQVTVLKVASSSAGSDALDEMESRWKRKLLIREFGLNAN